MGPNPKKELLWGLWVKFMGHHGNVLHLFVVMGSVVVQGSRLQGPSSRAGNL